MTESIASEPDNSREVCGNSVRTESRTKVAKALVMNSKEGQWLGKGKVLNFPGPEAGEEGSSST